MPRRTDPKLKPNCKISFADRLRHHLTLAAVNRFLWFCRVGFLGFNRMPRAIKITYPDECFIWLGAQIE